MNKGAKETFDTLFSPFNFKLRRKPGIGFLVQGVVYVFILYCIDNAYRTQLFNASQLLPAFIVYFLFDVAEWVLVAKRLRGIEVKHPILYSFPVFILPIRLYVVHVIIFVILAMWRKEGNNVDREN